MSYGANIYINGTAFDVVNAFAPSYVVAILTGSSGSASYDIPATTTLTAIPFIRAPDSSYNPVVKVSGNTVNWSGLGAGALIVYGA